MILECHDNKYVQKVNEIADILSASHDSTY